MRIRRAIGTPDSTYQRPEGIDPLQIGYQSSASTSSTYITQGPPRSLPDVPLNVDASATLSAFMFPAEHSLNLHLQHRYCTPPPMDPRFIDEPREKDDFPQYHGRHSYPSGYEETTLNQHPTAPDGSKNNPYVVEDDENARRHREARRQSAHSNKSESSGSHSSKSSSRQSSRAAPVRKVPAPPSRTPPALLPASSSSTSRTTRGGSSKGSSTPPNLTPIGKAKYQKTAADGYTPKAPSPLKQVAYAAGPRTNTPVSSAWYVPPRKHSTGSIVVAASESSSDSEYSDYE
ncbi:hypothetical protein C8Q70DRAFT_377604 [Cubamyces menziesii]|uniref:Uncharacterized protein n=1 Tax=Trametes cubensis TaxID=1111947 RepID=A0AAD7U2Z9_9APHY|nr:hypothetical protein C8Q70DRAFT_377604 [Cubamyces menziesii]KAJ8496578.1 hypothetical protein ONZ51_g1014 [Trametes cubensis]